MRNGVVEFLADNPEIASSEEGIEISPEVDAIHAFHALTQLEGERIALQKECAWTIADGYEGDPSLGQPVYGKGG